MYNNDPCGQVLKSYDKSINIVCGMQKGAIMGMKEKSRVSQYDVVYHSPGKSDRSAMPLGNGELAVSVWMDEKGVLRFYLARTDAVTELDRTVKLGMVEVRTAPGFLSDGDFIQRLELEHGIVHMKSCGKELWIWVDDASDIVYVSGRMKQEMKVKVRYYTWRTEKNLPWNSPVRSTGLTEAADMVDELEDRICFRHINGENGIEHLARLQCVDDLSCVPDLLSGRIFGGIMYLEGGRRVGHELVKGECTDFCLKVATHSAQLEEREWLDRVDGMLKGSRTADESREATAVSWEAFWKKSYIFVEGDKERKPVCNERILDCVSEPMECTGTASPVTRGYLLTKYMLACCKDGNFPVFYNGMLFNLCPGNREHLGVMEFVSGFTRIPSGEYPTLSINPDERSWSNEHLWQNLRLPYYTMLATGDFDSLKRLFVYFRRFWELNRIRAERFYHAGGQHNTEMTLSCGLQSEDIYGLEREGKPDGWSDNRWGGAIDISPGLELTHLLFAYYLYTMDEEFLRTQVLPYARELLRYIETRFEDREKGKIVIGPLQSVETYFDTVNPTPVIAGMRAVLRDFLALPEQLVDDRDFFERIYELTPELPTGVWNGEKVVKPAEEYEDVRRNVEAPELYAIYPFGLMGKYEDGKKAYHTFLHALETGGQMKPHILGENPGAPCYSGWQYIGNAAALLGLGDTAGTILENNCALQNPGSRFPAMWGPVYDAVPDTDHGANIMNLLQLMVLQCRKEKIYVLPALPDSWDVSFRLYAPYQTIVEAVYEEGRLISLRTIPESRMSDVIMG